MTVRDWLMLVAALMLGVGLVLVAAAAGTIILTVPDFMPLTE